MVSSSFLSRVNKWPRIELMLIADVCNPDLPGAHREHGNCGWAKAEAGELATDRWLAMSTRAKVEDSLRLDPVSQTPPAKRVA